MGTGSTGMPSGLPGMPSGDSSASSASSANSSGQSNSMTPQQAQAIAALLSNLGRQPQTVNGMTQSTPSTMLPQVQTPSAGQFVNTASRPNGQ